MLRWAGQFESAARIDAEIAFRPIREMQLPNQPLERRVLSDVTFEGRSTPLFPELGEPRLRIFTGVAEDLLRTAVNDPGRSESIAVELTPRLRQATDDAELHRREPNVSIGSHGACLVVEGLF